MSSDVPLATPQRLARLNEIDLLRFFAVMMVVLFHYAFRGYAANDMSVMPYPALAGMAKYGYLGVDLFFVISGFVILMTASSGSLQQFSVSRIVRLYPAFWFCCTVTFIATLAFGGTHFSATLGQYLVNMTMLNEFIEVKSIDQVYWSLAIELQFYVMVGLLIMCRQIPRSQFFLLAWLLAVIAAKVFPFGWALSALLIADYAACFIAGATCFLVYSRGATPTRLAMIAIAWVTASFGAVQTIPRLEAKLHSVFDPYVVASLIAVFFAAIFLVSMRWTAALSRYEWITLGALTYPLYLLHQNLGYMIFNIAYPALNPHLLIWGTIFLMLLCAFLVHKLIEKDFARFLKRILNKALATVFKRQTLQRQLDGSSG